VLDYHAAASSAVRLSTPAVIPRLPSLAAIVLTMVVATPAAAVTVRGGGAVATDCVAVFDAPGANQPPPPEEPRRVDCIDGDPSCDADGLRNGRCVFDLRLCINATAVAGCAPSSIDSLTLAHAEDDGDPRFDPDFQALQQRADLFDFPDNTDVDACTITSAVTVPLLGPTAGNTMRRGRKRVAMTATGTTGAGTASDRDGLRFTCRPEGDRVYLPRDLFTGTFDRIAQQVFAPRCAISGCHDSETFQNNLVLLPNSAYTQIVGVTPFNPIADAAGLQRIFPGAPVSSYLYRKITFDLEVGWGSGMPLTGAPLSPDLVELVRLWIIGDVMLGPAPATGWVDGTDQ
jgi:hypothetical protein